MPQQETILILLMGYLAVALKNIPTIIFDMTKAHLCSSISASSLRRDMYIKINDYILNLNNKVINNHLEYKTEWLGDESKSIATIGYGQYFVKVGTLTFAKISKVRIEGSTFEPDDRITVIIFGLKRKKIFKDISASMDAVTYHDQLKVYVKRDGLDYNLASKKSFDYIFSKEKDKIINFIDTWISQKAIYDKHQIVYKTGILLYGEPGTGKSTFCRAIASYLNYNIHVIDIQEFIDKPEELKERVTRITNNSVVLFEDIDCIIADRENENISDKSKFIIGTVLNILDGINSPNNVLFLATTNHIDKIDNAILRNGRFDLTVEISNIDRETAEEMCNAFEVKLDLDKYTYPINPSFLQNEILSRKKTA